MVSLAAQLLGVSADSADIACDRLCEKGKAASFEREQKEFIALYKYFEAESYTAGRMKTILEYPPIPITAIENQIDAIERVNGIAVSYTHLHLRRFQKSPSCSLKTLPKAFCPLFGKLSSKTALPNQSRGCSRNIFDTYFWTHMRSFL